MKSLGCSQESAAVQAQLSWHDKRGGDLPESGSAERNPKQEHPGRTAKMLLSSDFLPNLPLSFGPHPSHVSAPVFQTPPFRQEIWGVRWCCKPKAGVGAATATLVPWITGKYWIPFDWRRGLPGAHRTLPPCPERNSCAWPPPLSPQP